jgi:serine O-acetyltransferase
MGLKVSSTLTAAELAALAAAQANTFFPDRDPVAAAGLAAAAEGALARLEHCFVHIDSKYFFDGRQAVFDHLHGDQYTMWLYWLANEHHRRGGDPGECKKLFLLNKALHGCDLFYEVELPRIFLLVHPLGTVLGRARYADYLIAYQRVGVGSNHDVYPTLGEHLTLRPGSSVLGRCQVGRQCTIAAESLLLDRDLEPGSVYIGNPRACVTRAQAEPQPLWRTSPHT